MSLLEQLLSAAHAYAAAENLQLSTLSWRMFGDNKKLKALEDGADIQVRRLEQAMAWLSEHWPEGAEWPPGVQRPTRPTQDAAA